MNDKNFENLKKQIWFLTTNFFRENPDFFFPEEASISDGIIYNCSFCELTYDLHTKVQPRITRLSTLVDDEGCFFKVNVNKRWHYEGEVVYIFKEYYNMDKNLSGIEIYQKGFWEEQIFKEYYKRRRNLKVFPRQISQ